MKDDKHKREGQTGRLAKKNPGKDPKQDSRQDRLKLALRENLKRRKSQARGRDDTTASSDSDDVAAEHASKKHPGK